MQSLHIQTPLLESLALGKGTNANVWLKMEALQPSGSFKIRGIGFACVHRIGQGAKRLLSSSGGNAGLALAYAGRRLEVPTAVVVPQSTAELARSLIGAQGAEVIVAGASWNEAHQHALARLTEDTAYIHPFDDPLVWRGHASLVDEVALTGVRPDAVVLSVGGGGLLCGVLEGMHRNGWTDIPVLAVETLGADSLYRAKAAGHLVELEAITSIATTLGAKKVCQNALDWTRRHPIDTVVVSDAEAIEACNRFVNDQRILVEPACGAALASVYQPAACLKGKKNILVVVCGGAGVSLAQLKQWNAQLGR